MLKSLAAPFVLTAIAALIVAGYRPASAATTYSVSQVNGLALSGIPYGSSPDRSKIAGRATVSGSSRAHLYNGTSWSNIGTITGFATSQANDANDSGQTVGFVSKNTFGGNNVDDAAFVYTGGVMSQLPAFTGTGLTHAHGINNAGTIVGVSVAKPFRMNIGDAALTQLPNPAGGNGFGQASAINNPADIVGWAGTATQRVPAKWSGDGVNAAFLTMPVGALNAEARFITEGGVIAGTASYSGGTRGFLYDANGVPIDIGTFAANNNYSEILDINNAYQAVGLSQLNTSPFTRTPFLWQTGTMVDLNTLLPPASGWVLNRPISINDAGEILGLGTFNGTPSGFKLTPIPEPAAIAGVATIAAITAFTRRRARPG